jgi:hypothetical protein
MCCSLFSLTAQVSNQQAYNSIKGLYEQKNVDVYVSKDIIKATEKTLYLGVLLSGAYSVTLVANGIPSDSKTLIKQ